jgi:hypothetical protein
VIVVCGGAGELVGAPLDLAESVLAPAVAAAARVADAVVVDGGTAAGVMAVIGAVREYRPSDIPVLIGVAPRGRVDLADTSAPDTARLEANHTHFVLAKSNKWGGETRLLFGVAARIAVRRRAVVVLAGGGDVAIRESIEAVRRGWPIVVLRGSGGIADKLAHCSSGFPMRRLRRRRDLTRAPYIGCPAQHDPNTTLRGIAREGHLQVFGGEGAAELARWLVWELTDQPMLKDAWRTFAAYNRRANALRKSFARLQAVIISLGVLGTVVGLTYSAVGGHVLRWASIVAPSVIAVTAAIAGRRAAGKRWVLLRAAAEAVKVEIYRFRTRTGRYSNCPDVGPGSRVRQLADELEAIDIRLASTDASSAPMAPDDGDPRPPNLNGMHDDGLTDLDSDAYVEFRVSDQLTYYRGQVRRLDRLRNLLQTASLVAGGSGTAVAAAGAEPWIAVTTAISAGAVSYLSTLQIDNLVVVYNQSAAQLSSIRRRWAASDAGDDQREVLESIVAQAESVLTNELAGWVQQMNTAFRDQEARAAADAADRATSDHRRSPG